jgi:hypothetical protein
MPRNRQRMAREAASILFIATNRCSTVDPTPAEKRTHPNSARHRFEGLGR